MNIFKIIKEKSCTSKLNIRTKEEGLRRLSELLAQSVTDLDPEQIEAALWEREKLGSTGFEDGIAIPHAKVAGLKEFVVGIALCPKGIDFQSIDGKKTHLFFALIGPEENTEGHLQILAQISRISRNPRARKEMLNSHSGIALKENFIRYAGLHSTASAADQKKKLLFIVLNEKQFLEDIVNLFLENGIHGANVFDSTGIKSQLSNIPLFSDFLDFLRERSDVSKTIMAIVNESDINAIVDGIEQIMGSLDTHSGAMVCAVDLFYLKGTLQI